MKKLFFLVLVFACVSTAFGQGRAANPSASNSYFEYYLMGSSSSWKDIDTTTWDTTTSFKVGSFPNIRLHIIYHDTFSAPYLVIQQKFASETRWRQHDSIAVTAARGVNATANPREQCLALRTSYAGTNVDKFGAPDALYRIVAHWNVSPGAASYYSSDPTSGKDSNDVKLRLEFFK